MLCDQNYKKVEEVNNYSCKCGKYGFNNPVEFLCSDIPKMCEKCETSPAEVNQKKKESKMTKECQKCGMRDHESCMARIEGVELCRDCLLAHSEFDGAFNCECAQWSNNYIKGLFRSSPEGRFTTCKLCTKQYSPGPKNPRPQDFCDCPIRSVHDCDQNFYESLGNCKICDLPYGDEKLHTIGRFPGEEKQIENDPTCRCESIDIERMENRLYAGMSTCPECNKDFTRPMLESRKLHAADAIDAFTNQSQVDHPAHYQSGGMEVIDVIEAFKLGFPLGNAIKYILRAGKKNNGLQDLEKAVWYLKHEINKIIESHSFKGKKK